MSLLERRMYYLNAAHAVGRKGKGRVVLKVEGLMMMMMPVRRLSALTSPAGCFPEHTSALHLPLLQPHPAGQTRVRPPGVVWLAPNFC